MGSIPAFGPSPSLAGKAKTVVDPTEILKFALAEWVVRHPERLVQRHKCRSRHSISSGRIHRSP